MHRTQTLKLYACSNLIIVVYSLCSTIIDRNRIFFSVPQRLTDLFKIFLNNVVLMETCPIEKEKTTFILNHRVSEIARVSPTTLTSRITISLHSILTRSLHSRRSSYFPICCGLYLLHPRTNIEDFIACLNEKDVIQLFST